mgnify:CR=1 FL=1
MLTVNVTVNIVQKGDAVLLSVKGYRRNSKCTVLFRNVLDKVVIKPL